MTKKLLHESGGRRTFAVIFADGADPVSGLKEFARDEQIASAQVTAIGAFQRVVVGYFDWERKDYRRIRFDEQMEVLSLTGNLGLKDEQPALHAHVALGRADGTAHGGHLLEAMVRPTLEVIVTETPAHLRRRFDPATGLSVLV